ncbi:hypothetical protein BDV18DRAFT_151590 [Aspergillus unguis]
MDLNTETIQDRRQRLASIPKACEACRVRKVRCDRSSPCTNCRAAGIVCQQNAARIDSRNPDVSRLIERLDSRLGRIEDQLKDSPEITVEAHPTRLYEGSSSFTNQSAQASETAQLTAFTQGAAGTLNVLDDLNSLLQPSTTLADFQLGQGAARGPKMVIPSAVVADIVRSFKVRTPYCLTSHPVNDVGLVEDLFRRVYFPTETLSVGHVTAMHGILLSLLKEFIGFKHPLAEKHNLSQYLQPCEQNFTTGLERYELLIVPSFENILSLVLAVIKAQDEANIMLSSTLISVAARHCLMLGYHRLRAQSPEDPNIRRLFWTVYYIDKNMSLLLGRASCIQDYDIDVPYPSCTTDPSKRAWDECFLIFLTLGRIQGQIYDRVYSVAALKLSPETRAQNIAELAQELHTWRQRMDQIDWSHIPDPGLIEVSKPTWDIMYYSLLTALLRGSSTASTTPEISAECFAAARSALESHLRAFPIYQDASIVTAKDYANWVILYSSFTPFIVIFLHAIASSSLPDTTLLEDIVRTLDPLKETSKACGRLFQICTIFARVARSLVESRHSFLGTYNPQDDSLLLNLNNQGNASLYNPSSLQEYFTEGDMLIHTSMSIHTFQWRD